MSRAETLSVLMMAQSHRQLPTGSRCKNMVRPSLGPDLGHATATALTATDTPRHPGGRLCLHQRHRWPECVPPPGLHDSRGRPPPCPRGFVSASDNSSGKGNARGRRAWGATMGGTRVKHGAERTRCVFFNSKLPTVL
jgi:hypothetical protein